MLCLIIFLYFSFFWFESRIVFIAQRKRESVCLLIFFFFYIFPAFANFLMCFEMVEGKLNPIFLLSTYLLNFLRHIDYKLSPKKGFKKII